MLFKQKCSSFFLLTENLQLTNFIIAAMVLRGQTLCCFHPNTSRAKYHYSSQIPLHLSAQIKTK